MVIEELNRIRKLAIISLFYDDDLLTKFVLKGGNAISIVYGFNDRASSDIDISMEKDFDPDTLNQVIEKLENSFKTVFKEAGYQVFDIKLTPTPRKIREDLALFWGGYTLEFKVIDSSLYEGLSQNIDDLRRQSVVIGENQKKTFQVDISKYEFCEGKVLTQLDDYSIYVYSPVMVVFEKLRAICQQMEDYADIVPTHRRPRARDFFDVHNIVDNWTPPIDLYTGYNIEMLKEIFLIKRVPLYLLGNIINEREYHRDDFESVRSIVTGSVESYDYYFDYVAQLVKPLEYLWKQDSSDEEVAAGLNN